jgi:hypothetical protein
VEWWVWICVLLTAALTVGGAWEDQRSKRGALATILDLLSGGVGVLAIVAFAREDVVHELGRTLLPSALIAAFLSVVSALRDLREPMPELSPEWNRRANAIAAVVGLALHGTAFVAGVVVGSRAW